MSLYSGRVELCLCCYEGMWGIWCEITVYFTDHLCWH